VERENVWLIRNRKKKKETKKRSNKCQKELSLYGMMKKRFEGDVEYPAEPKDEG